MPSQLQWRQFLKVLNKREKKVFFTFFILFVFSSIFLAVNFYLNNTEEMAAQGGTYTEGVVGSPRYINPVYAAGFDIDRDLSELIFSGLLTYNGKGEIVTDLAESYEILEEGRVYEFTLKENLSWSDGEPLTADDVVFTIKTIQNPSIKSPLRANWLGVSIEKTSELSVRFEMSNPSAVFLENCTQKIMPEHIWDEISYQNFTFSIYNLKPVGSGPYKLKELSNDSEGNITSAELVANPFYHNGSPNIPKIKFIFFKEEKDLISAFKSGKINGFSLSSLDQYQYLKKDGFTENLLSLPRYFSVFLNTEESSLLAEENIRKALNFATDKQEIINTVLLGQGKVVDSPILPEIFGFAQPETTYEFNIEKAKELFIEAGFNETETGLREKLLEKTPAFQFTKDLSVGSKGNEVTELQKCLATDPEVYDGSISGYFGEQTKAAVIKFQEKYKEEILEPHGLSSGNGKVLSSTRAKLNELCAAPTAETLSLSFTLVTSNNAELLKVANSLKTQWERAGVELTIETSDKSTLEQDVIKPRNYEMLLFGEVLGTIPDPFPFWHSTQVEDPGLNLAAYEDKSCDKLLEKNRQSLDKEERKEALEDFQDIILKDIPAVFLYSPNYLYLLDKEIKGLDTELITDSSKRFSNIENWYIKTKRVWK